MTAPQAGAPAAGFGQAWPAHELEPVDACPYCGSRRFALAFSDVQDWAFRTAAGAWGFKDCLDCHSLYLATRPQEAFISKAYGSY